MVQVLTWLTPDAGLDDCQVFGSALSLLLALQLVSVL